MVDLKAFKMLVAPTGIEPVSKVQETSILSIELRGRQMGQPIRQTFTEGCKTNEIHLFSDTVFWAFFAH